MLSLEAENREIFESFVSGYFTISKSRRTFLKQNNKLVKVDGGAIGILENEATLLKWAVAGLMISDMLETADLFENKPNKVYDHHEGTKLFQDKFHNDKKVFKETLENLGNPFLEQEPQLVHIISKKVLDQKAIESVKCAKYIGIHQFISFVRERFIEGTSSIYNTIKKYSLALYRQKNSVVISTSKQKVVNLSSDCRLYSNLYIASQARGYDLD